MSTTPSALPLLAYREFTKYLSTRPPLPPLSFLARAVHVCTWSCAIFSYRDEIFICCQTGQVHYCTPETCTLCLIGLCERVCPVSKRSWSLEFEDTIDDSAVIGDENCGEIDTIGELIAPLPLLPIPAPSPPLPPTPAPSPVSMSEPVYIRLGPIAAPPLPLLSTLPTAAPLADTKGRKRKRHTTKLSLRRAVEQNAREGDDVEELERRAYEILVHLCTSRERRDLDTGNYRTTNKRVNAAFRRYSHYCNMKNSKIEMVSLVCLLMFSSKRQPRRMVTLSPEDREQPRCISRFSHEANTSPQSDVSLHSTSSQNYVRDPNPEPSPRVVALLRHYAEQCVQSWRNLSGICIKENKPFKYRFGPHCLAFCYTLSNGARNDEHVIIAPDHVLKGLLPEPCFLPEMDFNLKLFTQHNEEFLKRQVIYYMRERGGGGGGRK